MSKDYDGNLQWFLEDIANADADQIDSCKVDIYGETKAGADTSCEIDLRELCAAALARIRELEDKLELIRMNGDS